MPSFPNEFLLHLADNALILGHRNSEWCGHGPVLEQDIALTNISLDLIGQARNFYQHAAQELNGASSLNATEDTLAYLRDAPEFRNCLLVEHENGDWAQTILRQFLFSNYQSILYEQLSQHSDEQLAAIANKSLKEVKYHLRWSSEWVIRLGDGTDESHRRMNTAIASLWPYTTELYTPVSYEKGIDYDTLGQHWHQTTGEVFAEAGLEIPKGVSAQFGGKQGRHGEQLVSLLAEMQTLQRTYPNQVW